jgi:hypothetical protein
VASQSDDARIPEKRPAANSATERLLVFLPNEGRKFIDVCFHAGAGFLYRESGFLACLRLLPTHFTGPSGAGRLAFRTSATSATSPPPRRPPIADRRPPPHRPPTHDTRSSGAGRLTFRGMLPHFLRTSATSAAPPPTADTRYWPKWGEAPHFSGHAASLFAYSRHFCRPPTDRRHTILAQVGRDAPLFGAHCHTFCVLLPLLLPPHRPPTHDTGPSGAGRPTFRGTLPHFLRTPATSAASTPTADTRYWPKWGGTPHFSGHAASLFADFCHFCPLHTDPRHTILVQVGRGASLFGAHCRTFCGLLPLLPPPHRPPIRKRHIRPTMESNVP